MPPGIPVPINNKKDSSQIWNGRTSNPYRVNNLLNSNELSSSNRNSTRNDSSITTEPTGGIRKEKDVKEYLDSNSNGNGNGNGNNHSSTGNNHTSTGNNSNNSNIESNNTGCGDHTCRMDTEKSDENENDNKNDDINEEKGDNNNRNGNGNNNGNSTAMKAGHKKEKGRGYLELKPGDEEGTNITNLSHLNVNNEDSIVDMHLIILDVPDSGCYYLYPGGPFFENNNNNHNHYNNNNNNDINIIPMPLSSTPPLREGDGDGQYSIQTPGSVDEKHNGTTNTNQGVFNDDNIDNIDEINENGNGDSNKNSIVDIHTHPAIKMSNIQDIARQFIDDYQMGKLIR